MQSRAQAIQALFEMLADQPVIVCNGFPSREAQKIKDRAGTFYMIGSMGVAASIGLGLALAKPDQQVVVFDGDGNVLMGMGTLATIGALRPKNLTHVVFDNEVYGTTGNQPSYSRVVRLDHVAKAAGYATVERVWEREDIMYEFKHMLEHDGPHFLLIKVNEQIEDADRVALDPPEITKRFSCGRGTRENVKLMILLNPGPVNVSDRVRNALMGPDICHRESECAELIGNVRRKLLEAFVPGAESDYTAILLTGSGTAAVEASIMSCLPPGKRLIHVNNGVYGERISSIIATQRLGIAEIKYKWDTPPDPDTILRSLKQEPSAHGVVMCTMKRRWGFSTRFMKLPNTSIAVGASLSLMPSAGWAGNPWILPVVTCTWWPEPREMHSGISGVSFVLVRKGFMKNVLKYPKRGWYLNLGLLHGAGKRHGPLYAGRPGVCRVR